MSQARRADPNCLLRTRVDEATCEIYPRLRQRPPRRAQTGHCARSPSTLRTRLLTCCKCIRAVLFKRLRKWETILSFFQNQNIRRPLALLCTVLSFTVALGTLNQAHAQGIGLAGAYAVDYGAQDYTAQVTPDTVNGLDSVSLGWGTTSSGDYAVVLGTLSNDNGQSNVVSVGDANIGLTRRIINVAPGIASSDAATVGQLQSTTSGNPVSGQ